MQARLDPSKAPQKKDPDEKLKVKPTKTAKPEKSEKQQEKSDLREEITEEVKKKNLADKKRKDHQKARGPFDKRVKMEDPFEKRKEMDQALGKKEAGPEQDTRLQRAMKDL